MRLRIPGSIGIKWNMDFKLVNPFQPNIEFRIETSHLICTGNEMTGLNMKTALG